MEKILNRNRVKAILDGCEFQRLFIEELGWDNYSQQIPITVDEREYKIVAIAHKRNVIVFNYIGESGDYFPEYSVRQKIEKRISRVAHEHITIYVPSDKSEQYWHWVKRQPNSPDRLRTHVYRRNQFGEGLIQKLQQIVFTIEEEENLTVVDVAGSIRSAFDVEAVTKKFYDSFKREHGVFMQSIAGIDTQEDREWYTSLMLNRMMFIYFIQKRGFLDNDFDYLRNRLEFIQQTQRPNSFQTYYRKFLLRLFHEGLNVPQNARDSNLSKLIGNIPYLNGGLFEIHKLEKTYDKIDIPDPAFEKLFKFFDRYQWHLDDRPLKNDNEINPDVLGYIFEKYINQKDLGAYYTKEDITGYIARNTIIPFVLKEVIDSCSDIELRKKIWHLLTENPNRYISSSIKHGITFNIYENKEFESTRELPNDVNQGIQNPLERTSWSKVVPREFGLPNEIWREYVDRRKHYDDVSRKLKEGKIQSIDEFVTNNLNLERFALDIIAWCESPSLVHTFWKVINRLSVLDPTCGSGAFLFAALKILEPLYFACIESMRGYLADHESSVRKLPTNEQSELNASLLQIRDGELERYSVLKSIIINNLYGVDLIDEAVEICKLRLFLMLVAQLDKSKDIEPLPDIDFNIRSGNSIVGFASIDQLEFALRNNLLKDQFLLGVNRQAGEAAEYFTNFQKLQTQQPIHVSNLSDAKEKLKAKLELLRDELDKFLSEEYGIQSVDTKKQLLDWKIQHKPFHWFVEFWEIMNKGGFDVIIGNPPYLEANKVTYEVKFLDTSSTRAIHAMCIERSLELCSPSGAFGMILPMSIIATQRMKSVQNLLEQDRDCWFSNFAHRPSKLFDKVDLSLTIAIALRTHNTGKTFSTNHLMWNSEDREYLMNSIRYCCNLRPRPSFWIPKFGSNIEHSIYKKCVSIDSTIEQFIDFEQEHVTKSSTTRSKVYFRSAGGRYWKVFTNFRPLYRRNGVDKPSTVEVTLKLIQEEYVNSAISIFSSSTFWWWYTISSDLWHVTKSNDIGKFPIPISALRDPTLQEWGREYNDDLKVKSEVIVSNQKTGKVENQKFQVKYSKPIIDCIDLQLQSHYGFSDEETDFLINYDLKFRMGSTE